MGEVSIPERTKEDSLNDLVESTALERSALAELINAGAEELRRAMDLEDASIEKIIELQQSMDQVMDTSIEMQKTLQDDIKLAKELDIKSETTTEKNTPNQDVDVMEVEEEIIEEMQDGKKKIKKIIKKKK